MSLMILLFTVVSNDRLENLSTNILLVLMAFYLISRSRFQRDYLPANARFDVKSGPFSQELLSGLYGVIIFWTYTMLIFSLCYRGFRWDAASHEVNLEELIVSTIFSSVFLLIYVYQASKKFSKTGFLCNVGLVSTGISRFKTVVVPSLVGISFSFLAAYLLWQRKIQPSTPLSEILDQPQSPALIVIFILLAIVIAPLLEEIVFRGYLFHVLRVAKGRLVAILIVSLSFGILHVEQYWGDWLAIGMVGVLGFILTFLRVWANSTVASVTLHYVYNAGVMILPVIFLIVSNPAYFKYHAYEASLDDQEKIELLKESIKKVPDFPDAYGDLAQFYSDKNSDLEEALRLIDQALKMDPKNVDYQDIKNDILIQLDQADTAEAVNRESNFKKSDASRKFRAARKLRMSH